MTELRIAPADPRDHEALAALVTQLWSRNGLDLRGADEARALLERLFACGHEALLFLEGAEPVGYALIREGGDHVFIRHFLIRDDRRGQGLGRAAVAALTARIGPRPLRLDVIAGDDRAMGFWRAMGFAPAATAMRRPAPESAPDSAPENARNPAPEAPC